MTKGYCVSTPALNMNTTIKINMMYLNIKDIHLNCPPINPYIRKTYESTFCLYNTASKKCNSVCMYIHWS